MTFSLQHTWQLAEQAERYEDMKRYMTKIAETQGVLEIEERNLLSVAYKNIVGARRAAWRVISSLMGTASRPANESRVLEEYKNTVEKELDDLCQQILKMLEGTLIANSTGTEEKVVYDKKSARLITFGFGLLLLNLLICVSGLLP